MSSHRIPAALLAGAALAIAVAAPASADSIAFIKDGDVHLATPDGDRDFPVTQGGGYSTASQSDDGTILATKGRQLVRMDRQGQVLATFSTPVSITGGGGFTFEGPFDADLSPDGQKAAYGYFNRGLTSTSGGVYVNESNGTGFTHADRETAWSEPGFKQSTEYEHPEWVDDQRVIVSNGPGYPSSPIAIVEAGSGDSKSWFSDPENQHPLDITESPNRRFIAAVSQDRQALHVYRDGDDKFLGDVYACFSFSDQGAYKYASPTFNADGSKLMWADGTGIEVAPVQDLGAADCATSTGSKKVLPGGSNPDWGPADVPTARTVPFPGTPAPPPGTGTGPGTTPGTTPGTVPGRGQTPGASSTSTTPGSTTTTPAGGSTGVQTGSGALTLVAKPAALKAALRSGVKVTVDVPAAGKVALAARAKGKVVAEGSATAAAPGKVAVRLRFTAAARKSLRRSKTVSLTVSGTQGTARGALRLRLAR